MAPTPALFRCLALAAAAAASPAPPTPPATSSGVGVQVQSCSGSSFQRWTVAPSGSNASVVTLHPASDRTSCLTSIGATVFVTPCRTPASSQQQQWVQLAGAGGFVLQQSGQRQCATVKGCCDGGPLGPISCGTCNFNQSRDDARRRLQPADCLLSHNATSGAITTASSELCLDAGSPNALTGCALPSTKGLPFCNTKLSPDARAADLTSRLTLQEQASGILAMLMVPTSYANATPVHDNLRQTAGVARLGIPPILYNEAMHGIVALCLPSGACPTAFPEQITQSEFRNGLSPPCRLTPTVAAVSGFLQPLAVAGGGLGAGEGGSGAAQRKPRRR